MFVFSLDVYICIPCLLLIFVYFCLYCKSHCNVCSWKVLCKWTYLLCPLTDSMCVQAALRCACMWLCVCVCVCKGFTKGVMSHWNMDVTDAHSKSYFNYCWGVGDCPSDNPELGFCALSVRPRWHCHKPKSVSCNCAFSKVLHYSITVHLDVWMCVGRGKQEHCQLL